MVFGEQALPVRSELAAPETRKALPFSRVTWLTASATPELGTSRITSTPSTSYHWRAICEPTSALFWWSADTISTLMPFFAAPKSSTAMRAATTAPGPPTAEYRLDMSDSTPILTTPPETCAWAAAVAITAASASGAEMNALRLNDMLSPLFLGYTPRYS